MSKPKKYIVIDNYLVTTNERERTHGIWSKDGQLLSIVDDGEVMSEIRELNELYLNK